MQCGAATHPLALGWSEINELRTDAAAQNHSDSLMVHILVSCPAQCCGSELQNVASLQLQKAMQSPMSCLLEFHFAFMEFILKETCNPLGTHHRLQHLPHLQISDVRLEALRPPRRKAETGLYVKQFDKNHVNMTNIQRIEC